MVMALDPTRPAMTDGGDAGLHAQLPIYGNHYIEFADARIPRRGVHLRQGIEARRRPVADRRRQAALPRRELFRLGISALRFLRDGRRVGVPRLGGARRGVGLFAKMLAEGYRWHGVAAYQFWFGPDRADLQ